MHAGFGGKFRGVVAGGEDNVIGFHRALGCDDGAHSSLRRMEIFDFAWVNYCCSERFGRGYEGVGRNYGINRALLIGKIGGADLAGGGVGDEAEQVFAIDQADGIAPGLTLLHVLPHEFGELGFGLAPLHAPAPLDGKRFAEVEFETTPARDAGEVEVVIGTR